MKKNDYQSPEELAMQEALDRIREEYPDFWMDMDGLSEDTTKPDSEKRQRRKFRRRLIAACFIGVCLLSTALTIFVNSDTAHAVKFAMEKKYYQAKGWVQATDPGRVDDKNMMTALVTDENKISTIKMLWRDLPIPNYVIDEYSFAELYIEKYVNGFVEACYKYTKKDDNIFICIRNDISDINYQLWLNSKDVCNGQYDYYIWTDATINRNGIEIIMDELVVSVYGSAEIEELVKIVNGLQ